MKRELFSGFASRKRAQLPAGLRLKPCILSGTGSFRISGHKIPPAREHGGAETSVPPSSRAGERKARNAFSLEGSAEVGDSAPDGAAAPRASACRKTGRGVTGSFPSRSSPEMRAGASLPSRILRFLECSRMRAGLEPEPIGDRRASGRNLQALSSGARAFVLAGARGGGTALRVRTLSTSAPPVCASFSIFVRGFAGPARRKRCRHGFFFSSSLPHPPQGLVFLAGSKVSFKSLSKV